jgi:hypothetical protein
LERKLSTGATGPRAHRPNPTRPRVEPAASIHWGPRSQASRTTWPSGWGERTDFAVPRRRQTRLETRDRSRDVHCGPVTGCHRTEWNGSNEPRPVGGHRSFQQRCVGLAPSPGTHGLIDLSRIGCEGGEDIGYRAARTVAWFKPDWESCAPTLAY